MDKHMKGSVSRYIERENDIYFPPARPNISVLGDTLVVSCRGCIP